MTTVMKGVFIMPGKGSERSRTTMLVTISLLVAMEIVLNRFLSINAWNIKIGLSFIPVVVAAILFGPVPAGIVAALGDFIGAILFPIGMYFPGFTLTAFLTGCVFGLFLYKKHRGHRMLRIAGSVAINQFVLSLFLNTFWISVLYGAPYWPLFMTRIVQALILTGTQLIVIYIMENVLQKYGTHVFVQQE